MSIEINEVHEIENQQIAKEIESNLVKLIHCLIFFFENMLDKYLHAKVEADFCVIK